MSREHQEEIEKLADHVLGGIHRCVLGRRRKPDKLYNLRLYAFYGDTYETAKYYLIYSIASTKSQVHNIRRITQLLQEADNGRYYHP